MIPMTASHGYGGVYASIPLCILGVLHDNCEILDYMMSGEGKGEQSWQEATGMSRKHVGEGRRKSPTCSIRKSFRNAISWCRSGEKVIW